MIAELTRIAIMYAIGFIFKELMAVMDRKEIGNMIKIASIIICVGWTLELFLNLEAAFNNHPLIKSLIKIGDGLENIPFVGTESKWQVPEWLRIKK